MKNLPSLAGADRGFSVGGGANPPGGAPAYTFARYSEKLHEIKKILVRRGGGAPPPPIRHWLEIPSQLIVAQKAMCLPKILSQNM